MRVAKVRKRARRSFCSGSESLDVQQKNFVHLRKIEDEDDEGRRGGTVPDDKTK